MIDQTGARKQESLRTSPSQHAAQNMPYPLRGIVSVVHYHDSEGNTTKQTVVDVQLLGGHPLISGVPLGTNKINSTTGEEWTPDPGDGVIVQFINGNWNDPIVTGYYKFPDNEIQAATADAPHGKRRYHRRCNKTDLVIDKDGNRIEHVEGNETITIKGHETVTVETGDITVDVVAGKCTVHVKGKTVWKSDGTIDMDGGSSDMSGVVTKTCLCSFTGLPHMDYSGNVRASKG